MHGVKFISDNAGRIAFDLPELMGTEVWLHVQGHSVGVDKAFGYHTAESRLLLLKAVRTCTVTVSRRVPARIIGRLTSRGWFVCRESKVRV